MIIIAICMACSIVYAEDLQRVDGKKAKSLFIEHLKAIGRNTEEHEFNLRPIGKSTWLINCFTRGLSPSLPWRFVMNSRGRTTELTMDSLTVVFLNEYPSSHEKKDQEQLIQEFIELHAGENIEIIRKISDIPGYTSSPLDTDIADAVRSPFSFGKLTTVVYTYQQIDGIVRRYRFTFENGITFKKAEVAVVGQAIGDAQYYE